MRTVGEWIGTLCRLFSRKCHTVITKEMLRNLGLISSKYTLVCDKTICFETIEEAEVAITILSQLSSLSKQDFRIISLESEEYIDYLAQMFGVQGFD
nr:MAG TPA: hypothetical protein [Caudoviricetes sp.]